MRFRKAQTPLLLTMGLVFALSAWAQQNVAPGFSPARAAEGRLYNSDLHLGKAFHTRSSARPGAGRTRRRVGREADRAARD